MTASRSDEALRSDAGPTTLRDRTEQGILAVVFAEAGPLTRVDIAGRTGLSKHTVNAPPRSPEDVARQLEQVVLEASDHARSDRTPLRAVAISVAEPVDPRTLSVIELPDTPYQEGLIQPAQILAERIAAPLLVDNDVNLAALGEQRSGVGKDVPIGEAATAICARSSTRSWSFSGPDRRKPVAAPRGPAHLGRPPSVIDARSRERPR